MNVIKRDGRQVAFDPNKIAIAMHKACSHINSDADIEPVYQAVIRQVLNHGETIAVEEIQDIIEDFLIKAELVDVAKEYIRYRHERTNIREGKSTILKVIDELTNDAGSETQRENANINALTTSGTMLKYGSETAKEYNLRYLIKPEIAKLHREGAIHIH